MKKLYYLFLALVLITPAGLNAQGGGDTITHLIISEVRQDRWIYFYVEFTNMHPTDSVFLGDFVYQNLVHRTTAFVKDGNEVRLIDQELSRNHGRRLPDKKLAAGESFVLMNVEDVWNGGGRKHARIIQSPELTLMADDFIHRPDWSGGSTKDREYPVIPELHCFGYDSLDEDSNAGGVHLATAGALIWSPNYLVQVMVDQVLAEVNWDLGTLDNDLSNPVSTAGIPGAHNDYTLVRKFDIKSGETNWTTAKGDNPKNSSWMLIPHRKVLGQMPFRTAGNHGNFSFSFSSDVCEFDALDGTLTVPWGTEKFDSITNNISLGEGMAWRYVQNGNQEDSLSMISKENDTLVLYNCGKSLRMLKFAIRVSDPLDSDKTVFGKRQIRYPDPISESYVTGEVAVIGDHWSGPEYQVDEYETVMDTIGFVPFATPVDTFFRLIEKPGNATWELRFKSGEESSELVDGDVLRVTAEDGSFKDYYIQVEGYIGNDDVLLDAITWPDRPDGVFMEGWGYNGLSDTIPGFSPAGESYTITLPEGSTSIPVLAVTTRDLNAKVEVQQATSLKGGFEERMTTFHIRSETDTTFRTITVRFEVFNPGPQKFEGDPIFSKIYIRDWWVAGGIEILNPGDYPVNLGEYMIVRTEGTAKADGLNMLWAKDSNVWRKRYKRWVPGYKWGSYAQWMEDPGWLYPDGIVNPFIGPKDVLVTWRNHTNLNSWGSKYDFFKGPDSPVDVFFNNDLPNNPGIYDNPWAEVINSSETVSYPVHVNVPGSNTGIYYLLKIINDSVVLGTKKANDPDDYEVVDVMGSDIVPWNVAADTMSYGECYLLWRKPHIYYGDTILAQRNHRTNADSSQWFCYQTYLSNVPDLKYSRNANQLLLGSHPLDPVTGHLSIIFSTVYNVSRGFSENETITGVSRGEDPAAFLSNIIKADPGQVLQVLSGGVEKTTGSIIDGDVLEVSSVTGNVTNYIISTVSIPGDASLTALDTTVTVTVTAPFEVGGFFPGVPLAQILGSLGTANDSVIVTVLDSKGEPVPLQKRNSRGNYAQVATSDDFVIQVVAPDGTTRIYDLVSHARPSDAFIYSDIFSVQEEPAKIIGEIPFGTGVRTFLDGISSSKGAHVKLVILTGQERISGKIGFGDRIIVTSSDSTMISVYKLQFSGSKLPHLTSDIFTIDPVVPAILGIREGIDVAGLLENLSPSSGSSMVLLDSTGTEKTSGTVLSSDVVYLLSGDRVNSVTYKLLLNATITEPVTDTGIRVYPNPASRILCIENVPPGSYIRLVDINGRTAKLLRSGEINGGIDLSDLNSGVYVLLIETEGHEIMRTRIIKK